MRLLRLLRLLRGQTETSTRYDTKSETSPGHSPIPNAQEKSGTAPPTEQKAGFFGRSSPNPPPISRFYPRDLKHFGVTGSPVQNWAGELVRLFAGICGVLRGAVFAAIVLEKLEWKQWRSPRTVHAWTGRSLEPFIYAGLGVSVHCLLISGFRVQVPGGVREARASTPGFFLLYSSRRRGSD